MLLRFINSHTCLLHYAFALIMNSVFLDRHHQQETYDTQIYTLTNQNHETHLK